MSAEYQHIIADENLDLHKRLGCMNGLFQIFGRRVSNHSRKRIPPGESGNSGKEPNNTKQKSTEKNHEEYVTERERTSVELSGSLFSSSSCSSTFTSIDSNKLAQPDPSVLGQNALAKTLPRVVPKKQSDPCLYPGQQSPDIRSIIKDSIQRETRELSIKTKTKAEGKRRVMKHIDSPRPQQVLKPESPRVPAPDRSSQVFGTKERNSPTPPEDARRFSYDERESRDNWKSVAKLRELPRFSLDSRASSIQRAASESRSNSLLEDLQQRNDRRLSIVVAKLMGLEDFPDHTDADKSRPQENLDPISTSSLRKVDQSKHNQISNSPTLTPRDTSSPRLRNVNSSAKPNPRSALEPSPRRRRNEDQKPQNSAGEPQLKPETLYPSVYGQIKKSLTELEFKKSGEDLRASKQIVEAMLKAPESIKAKKDESSYKLNFPSTEITTPTIKGSNSPKKFEASIAIARPAKVVQKPKISASSPLPMEGMLGLRKLRTTENTDMKKELIRRKNQVRESSRQSVRPMDKRISAATSRSKQASVSPRRHHNKHGVEKKSHPVTKTSEVSTPKRPANWNQREIFSPSSAFKQNLHVWRRRDDDQFSDISSKAGCLSHQADAFSARSESNISTASQNDDVTSNYRSEVRASMDEYRSKSRITSATFEQPSPVSVLDAAFYAEGSPSPVKQISSAFTDGDSLTSDEAPFNLVELVNFPNKTRSDLVPGFEGEKLENIKHLNDKFRKVDSHDEPDADSIASLCESTDSMHRYVAEILLVSGLFKDLGPSSTFTQLHPSGHLINPHLFHILEHAKRTIEVEDDEQSNGKKNQSKLHEKVHRKLVFDTTDEILVHIFITAGFSNPYISASKMRVRSLTGSKLLEKICLEMNNIRTNPECSLPYEDGAVHHDIPGVVLDIERLIFKDLICEIVSGKAGPPNHLNRRRRQLFTN